jgi:UDP-N-acetyl-2-amino-2-deoxyglucuronate dehydrogenase
MIMKHGFGIIGTGAIADFHAKSIMQIKDAELFAVYDIDHKKSKAFGEKYHCASCNNQDVLLKDKRIDIVCICTPSGLHLEPALSSIGYGKHCIIEKPLEVTLERCDMIIDAAKRKGVLIEGIFPSRFLPVNQEIRKAIDENRFGKFVLGDAYVKWFRSQEYYDSVKWRGTWKFDGGGALMNQAIHSVDLLQWYMGPVVSVQALTACLGHSNIEVEDSAVAILKFANGALGVIEGTVAVFPGSYKRIEILGTEGSVVMEEDKLVAWRFLKETNVDDTIRKLHSGSPDSGGGVSNPMAINITGHKCQIEDMIMSLDKGNKPMIDGHEARKSVEIVLNIYKSAGKGELVKM